MSGSRRWRGTAVPQRERADGSVALDERARKMNIRSVTAAALGAGMLLTGCGSPPAPETTRTVTSAATKAPKTVPNVTGKTFGEAHDLLVASGIIYVAVGSDGAKFTDTPPRTAVVAGAHPGVGIEVPGGTVTLKIKGSEKDLVAKSAAAKAKSAAEASAVASLSSRTDARDRPSSCGGMYWGPTSSSDWPEN